MDEAQAKSIEDKIVLVTNKEAKEVLDELYKMALKLKDISGKQHNQLKELTSAVEYWKDEAETSLKALVDLREKYQTLDKAFRDVSFQYAQLSALHSPEKKAAKVAEEKIKGKYLSGAWYSTGSLKSVYDPFVVDNPAAEIQLEPPVQGQL